MLYVGENNPISNLKYRNILWTRLKHLIKIYGPYLHNSMEAPYNLKINKTKHEWTGPKGWSSLRSWVCPTSSASWICVCMCARMCVRARVHVLGCTCVCMCLCACVMCECERACEFPFSRPQNWITIESTSQGETLPLWGGQLKFFSRGCSSHKIPQCEADTIFLEFTKHSA